MPKAHAAGLILIGAVGARSIVLAQPSDRHKGLAALLVLIVVARAVLDAIGDGGGVGAPDGRAVRARAFGADRGGPEDMYWS